MTVYELTGGCCDTRLEFGFPTAPDFPATTTKNTFASTRAALNKTTCEVKHRTPKKKKINE